MYNENYVEDDLKYARFTFNKYFQKYNIIRDDLIQTALCILLKNKCKFDETKGLYSTFAVKVCKNAMSNFLKNYGKSSNYGKNLSLDFEYEDNTLADLIPFYDNVEDKLFYERVFQLFRDEVLKNKSETFRKINLLYLDFVSPSEIIKKLNISRQCVNSYIHKFQNLIRAKYSDIVF